MQEAECNLSLTKIKGSGDGPNKDSRAWGGPPLKSDATNWATSSGANEPYWGPPNRTFLQTINKQQSLQKMSRATNNRENGSTKKK